jgi:hypothetical protein
MSVISASSSSPNWVVIGVAAVFIGTIAVVRWLQNSRAQKNLASLANRLGFTITGNGYIPFIQRYCNSQSLTAVLNLGDPPDELGIQGQIRGRSVRFSEFVTGSGRIKLNWAELAVATHANQFTFSLRQRDASWGLMALRDDGEVKIGDDDFDRRWRFNSNDGTTLRTLMTPELRGKIDQFGNQIGAFFLENDWICYRESGDFSNSERVGRYEKMVGLMGDLAEAIEVAAEKFTLPPPSTRPAYDDEKGGSDWGEASPDYDRSP